jgi:IPT/TIG domain
MSDPTSADNKPSDGPKNTRTTIFIYDLVVLAVLMVIGVLYFKHHAWFDLGGDPQPGEGGGLKQNAVNLSIHCMWFGALGGIIISLKGVYDHAIGGDPWKDDFNLWHIGRPVSGAMAGLMTFLLLLVFNPASTPSEPIAYAAAFIFGTQERRFFNLLSEVARLIVQVPSETTQRPLTLASIAPNQGTAGTPIKIVGAGFDPKATATLGGAAIGNLEVKDATSITGLAPAKPAGVDEADLVVTNPDGTSATLPKAFRFTG